MLRSDFVEKLQNPPKAYRPLPFWSWNERLEADETRRQIAEMDRAGIGGYFMHARGGLQTAYMGSGWMTNIAAGIDEARKRGMGAWAYDENGWPSGFGDGRVNGRGVEFQQKYLRCDVVADQNPRDDGRTIAHTEMDDGRILHFYYDVNPFYVDTLDPEVVRTFIDEIYAPYAARFGDDFGAAMPGFFTDEPQVSRNGIPWSFTLPDRYREAYGEELLPHLPELFHETGDFRRTRYRFWLLVQELFVTAFTQQIYEWCEENGCKLTGHMVLEETLLSQITSNAAVMPHYEFFHIPGMDWLGRHIDPPTTPLQVASVAHQLDRPHVLSETFALTGWNVSFTELKWIYEWQMVRGVTQLCQHLEGYSLRGIRKRDYPPSLFYQQPWWDQYRFFNDAMTRIGMLLADGRPAFRVLVVHPQRSAWLHFDGGGNDGVQDLNRQWLDLTKALEHAHVPFHYGDERILERHAESRDGTLVVGTQTYDVVIVPGAETLAAHTAELLRTFAGDGGTLVWLANTPALVDGMADRETTAALAALGRVVARPEEIMAELPDGLRLASIVDTEGSTLTDIGATSRLLDESLAGLPLTMLYLVNHSLEQGYDAVIRTEGACAARFVPETGGIEAVEHQCTGSDVVVPHRFEPGGSLVLFVSAVSGKLPAAEEPRAPATPLAAERFDPVWDLELLDPNAITLDTCDVFFDGRLVASNEHISVVQKRALDEKRPIEIALRFTVEVAPGYTPPEDTVLVVEQARRTRIRVNGKLLENLDRGFYRDMSFRKIDLQGALTEGRNTIIMTTRFHQAPEVYEALRRAREFEAERNKLTYDSEIEAVYIVGAFGVQTPGSFETLPRHAMRYRGPFVIGPAPESARLGDLTAQGLPFFNGTVRLSTAIDLSRAETHNRSFRLGRVAGHIAALRVNGEAVDKWYWPPYEARLDDVLTEGENRVEIELTGGLRNLLGPHHLEEGESYAVGPGSFFKEPNIWGNRPWNEDTCLVEFGVWLP